MKFLYRSFKAKKKQIVRVSIDRDTKVKLMTAYDLKKYKQGRTHRYRGGTFGSGAIILRIPSDGIWYAVVEKGGYGQQFDVSASVQLLAPDKSAMESTAMDARQPAERDPVDQMLDEADGPVEELQEEASEYVEGSGKSEDTDDLSDELEEEDKEG